eukprot:508104-Pleurochrysis_carterae.AAC.1
MSFWPPLTVCLCTCLTIVPLVSVFQKRSSPYPVSPTPTGPLNTLPLDTFSSTIKRPFRGRRKSSPL